jgi:3-phosphoshikimate 1-carboxyvinyltransferase
MEVEGLSPAQDVQSSLAAIQKFGVQTIDHRVNLESDTASTTDLNFHILLDSHGIASWIDPSDEIDVGNSGTTIRVLAGMVAGSTVRAVLTGDESIRRRPMGRVIRPLRSMGAQIRGSADDEHAPLVVEGARLQGVDHKLEVASAQVKTALLLAGLRAEGTTTVVEPAKSRDHTERLLHYLKVPIDVDGNRLIVKSTNFQNAFVSVPGDISSAAFLLVAAAILPGSDLTIEGVGLNPTRTGIIDLLRRFGAIVETNGTIERCGEPVGSVRVQAADRKALEVSGAQVVAAIDELPLVAVLGAVAEGTTVVRDAAELRVKESDRIESIVRGLEALGVATEGTPDGFVVHGNGTLAGGEVDSADDHRIAMAFAVAALAATAPSRITGWDAVAVSYPRFEQALDNIVVR